MKSLSLSGSRIVNEAFLKSLSIYYGCSLALPRRVDSNEYPQLMFLWKNQENCPKKLYVALPMAYCNTIREP